MSQKMVKNISDLSVRGGRNVNSKCVLPNKIMYFATSEDPEGDCEDYDQLVLDPEMHHYVKIRPNE
jgi:hypothetical protein